MNERISIYKFIHFRFFDIHVLISNVVKVTSVKEGFLGDVYTLLLLLSGFSHVRLCATP